MGESGEINHHVNYLVGDYHRCFEIFLASKNRVFQVCYTGYFLSEGLIYCAEKNPRLA